MKQAHILNPNFSPRSKMGPFWGAVHAVLTATSRRDVTVTQSAVQVVLGAYRDTVRTAKKGKLCSLFIVCLPKPV